MTTKYSYSTDEEGYHGTFDTIEAACDAAAAHRMSDGGPGHFWVGEQVAPSQPEEWWEASDWLEHVSVQDEYGCEWAEGWDESTKDERAELEAEVRKVMAAWLDRHDLRPKFYNVDRARKYAVVGKVGDVFEIEALS